MDKTKMTEKKTSRITIKLRLTIGFTLIALIFSALACLATFGGGAMIADDRVKRPLRETVTDLAAEIKADKKLPATVETDNDDLTLAIITKEGELKVGTFPETLGLQPVPDSKTFFRIADSEGTDYFIYDKKITIDKKHVYYLRGYAPTPTDDEVRGTMITTAAIAAPCALIATALFAYILSKKLLAPLDRLSAATNAIIDGKDLVKNLPSGKNHDEVWELTQMVNAMLDRLDKSFESEKQFISDASHELRTPTAVILAQCELLMTADETTSTDEYKVAIETVARQAGRMKRLVLELLELSRIDRGKVEKNFEKTDVSRLVSVVCDEQRELHADSNITLNADIDPQITAEVNPSLYIRLATNLISNAYQYGRTGGHVSVTLGVSKLPGRSAALELAVEDDGIGIAGDQLPKIWERFYRVDNSRSDTGSSGLGLTMVKWIAGYHDGSVRAESTLGKGSKFTVTMPMKRM